MDGRSCYNCVSCGQCVPCDQCLCNTKKHCSLEKPIEILPEEKGYHVGVDIVDSFNCTIYLGLKRRYDGKISTFDEAEIFIQNWIDNISWCVTVTRTEYMYKNGREPGLIIGFINYPRFPATPTRIKQLALELAEKLMLKFEQFRVTVACPSDTIMLSNRDLV
jgi:hypothetical protein